MTRFEYNLEAETMSTYIGLLKKRGADPRLIAQAYTVKALALRLAGNGSRAKEADYMVKKLLALSETK